MITWPALNHMDKVKKHMKKLRWIRAMKERESLQIHLACFRLPQASCSVSGATCRRGRGEGELTWLNRLMPFGKWPLRPNFVSFTFARYIGTILILSTRPLAHALSLLLSVRCCVLTPRNYICKLAKLGKSRDQHSRDYTDLLCPNKITKIVGSNTTQCI